MSDHSLMCAWCVWCVWTERRDLGVPPESVVFGPTFRLQSLNLKVTSELSASYTTLFQFFPPYIQYLHRGYYSALWLVVCPWRACESFSHLPKSGWISLKVHRNAIMHLRTYYVYHLVWMNILKVGLKNIHSLKNNESSIKNGENECILINVCKSQREEKTTIKKL